MTMSRGVCRPGRKVYRSGETKGMSPGVVLEVIKIGHVNHRIKVEWSDGTIELVTLNQLRLTPPGTKPGTWSRKSQVG